MKKIIVLLIALVTLGGCSLLGGDEKTSDYKTVIEKIHEEQEWESEGFKEGEMNKVFKTTYLDFQVTSFEAVSEFEGYTSEEGSLFYVVGVEVTNTAGATIPVGTYDFAVYYEDSNGYMRDIAYENIGSEEMYPNDIQLADGETVSGKVVFSIPEDANLVSFAYDEVHVTTSGDTQAGKVYSVPLK